MSPDNIDATNNTILPSPPLPVLTASIHNIAEFEPISVLTAELRHQVMSGRASGFVGFKYDANGTPTHRIVTDGTCCRSARFDLPVMAASGSQNYHIMAAAARLAQGWDVDGTKAALIIAYAAAQGHVGHGAVIGFMGTEIGLGVPYFKHHFLAWLAVWVYTGWAPARTWVVTALALVAMSRDDDSRRVLVVGQRGALPGVDKPNWVDGLGDVMVGVNHNKPRQDGGHGWTHEWELLDQWAAIVRQISLGENLSSHITDKTAALAILKSSTMYSAITWRWLMGDGGRLIAAYQDVTIHGATPPLLAAAVIGGVRHTLPARGGAKRIRSQHDHATCVMANRGRSLEYEARHSRPSPDRITLTGVRYVITWWGKYVTVATIDEAVDQPSTPTTPADPVPADPSSAMSLDDLAAALTAAISRYNTANSTNYQVVVNDRNQGKRVWRSM